MHPGDHAEDMAKLMEEDEAQGCLDAVGLCRLDGQRDPVAVLCAEGRLLPPTGPGVGAACQGIEVEQDAAAEYPPLGVARGLDPRRSEVALDQVDGAHLVLCQSAQTLRQLGQHPRQGLGDRVIEAGGAGWMRAASGRSRGVGG